MKAEADILGRVIAFLGSMASLAHEAGRTLEWASELLAKLGPAQAAPRGATAATNGPEGGVASPGLPLGPTTVPPPDAADAGIDALIRARGGSPDADLLRQIMLTALKLADDRADRGDLKLVVSTLKELRYAARVFAPYRHVRKVTIFGSARTKPGDAAYRQAVEFARRMAAYGFMVITGAGPGIMQAGHEGAGRDMSFGVNIRLPFEQAANPVIAGDAKLVTFKYFFTRKITFLKESSAIALFPGGFGTHDEAAEALTLLQTGKRYPIPVLLVDVPGGTYWKAWDAFLREHLLGRAFVSPEDFALYRMTESVEEACDAICRFYKNYHSMRYVGQKLVLRLQRLPRKEALEELGRRFADIVREGRLEATGPLPEERNEPELSRLPRVCMEFDRRGFGRLRELIDALNEF